MVGHYRRAHISKQTTTEEPGRCTHRRQGLPIDVDVTHDTPRWTPRRQLSNRHRTSTEGLNRKYRSTRRMYHLCNAGVDT